MPASDSTKSIKRLIVLCDGTAQDSTSDEFAYPTNVTRISRAISKEATMPDGSRVQQIIYYQPGVGTSPTDKLSGGIYGEGLSANVRAAYGFLAHNYDEGDEIFFFGYSRGAYTARSIAGLVTFMGLLTKRGMDSFPDVYNAYYKHSSSSTEPVLPPGLKDALIQNKDLNEGAKDAIQVIGIWDTVGFHGSFGGEKIELYNQRLSPAVKRGYHALAFDEERFAFKPTLWDPPDNPEQIEQVWFSGEHADIGGGRTNHRLSDIPLMWMIAKCAEGNKLEFNLDHYILDHSKEKEPADAPWATALGPNEGDPNKGWFENAFDKVSGVVEGLGFGVREVATKPGSQEMVHVSIQSRDLEKWPCKPLARADVVLPQATMEPNGIELEYKGRLRPAVSAYGGVSAKKKRKTQKCVIL